MQYLKIIGIILTATIAGAAAVHPGNNGSNAEKTVALFKTESVQFRNAADRLLYAVQSIDSNDIRTVLKAKIALKNCRIQYKDISFFIDYFFPQAGWTYNAPAKYEIEEPFMEYEEPHGLQQIEALLFDSCPARQQTRMSEQATVISESAKDLGSLVYQLEITDAQIMESLHLELIRIMSLYISGYDAPFLKSGVEESLESLRSLQVILMLYCRQDEQESQRLGDAMEKAIRYIEYHSDFDAFDRLTFLSVYALPLERQLTSFIRFRGLLFSSFNTLDYSKPDIFTGEIVNATIKNDPALISLGQKLFSDKQLSGNYSRSCNTCHQPGKYFTDQLARNTTLGLRSELDRNTPTLLYTSYQTTQFWDGRAKTPTEQIREVLTSPREMNASDSLIESRLNDDTEYLSLFEKAFPLTTEKSITMEKVSMAIAGFVSTLAPMDSPFDQYIKGDKGAMNTEQQYGFNLFMGKAQCGTCHFIPFFNGLTPPFFNRSEYEVLGVPKNDYFISMQPDTDAGRYAVFPSIYYRGAFKTPTLRNISRTGPYMHNGKFRSLEKVLEFYNRGGGVGMGMDIPDQTLSPVPLGLDKKEIKAIIAFLDALTDRYPLTK